MKHLVLALIAIGACGFALADTAEGRLDAPIVQTDLPIWQPQGGERIRFDVLRKGKPFGTHNLDFTINEDGALEVASDIDLTVKIGPITAFKYRHDSVEMWEEGRLVSLIAETRKEGDDFSVMLEETGDGLLVQATEYNGSVPATTIPSSHWHVGEVFSDAILSTEGGKLMDISVERLGVETVQVGGQAVSATRFRLVADMAVDLWYDDEGRWVKCAFQARGQDIEYVLQSLY